MCILVYGKLKSCEGENYECSVPKTHQKPKGTVFKSKLRVFFEENISCHFGITS